MSKCPICKTTHTLGEGDSAKEKYGYMFRGYTWKMKADNGAIFEWWTPEKVMRKVAKLHLLYLANGGESYDKKDLGIYPDDGTNRFWETRGGYNARSD
jgi:hypothetical protein